MSHLNNKFPMIEFCFVTLLTNGHFVFKLHLKTNLQFYVVKQVFANKFYEIIKSVTLSAGFCPTRDISRFQNV